MTTFAIPLFWNLVECTVNRSVKINFSLKVAAQDTSSVQVLARLRILFHINVLILQESEIVATLSQTQTVLLALGLESLAT